MMFNNRISGFGASSRACARASTLAFNRARITGPHGPAGPAGGSGPRRSGAEGRRGGRGQAGGAGGSAGRGDRPAGVVEAPRNLLQGLDRATKGAS